MPRPRACGRVRGAAPLLALVALALAGCLGEPDRGCILEVRPEPDPLRPPQEVPAAFLERHPWFRTALEGPEGGSRSLPCAESGAFMRDLAAAGVPVGDEGRRAFVVHQERTYAVVDGRVVA
jgi:hypothetical protein